ncbi:MAG: AAA family ATPase [bacterium]
MFERSIFTIFNKWVEKKDRKPLVLRGARQVGKTTAVNIWAKKFDNYLYFNLELPEDRQIFEQDISFEELVESIFFNKNIVKGKGTTLIFIDEIQHSPQAVTLLRYFYEKTPDLYIMAAGSLLETLIDRHISFPVGRVEYRFMRPLSFFEYLKAIEENQASELLTSIPVPEYAHVRLMKLFNRYTLMGGMPEIVRVYKQKKDLTQLKSIYDSLITAYMDDVEKYASNPNRAKVLRHIIKNAFYEAGNRITFQGFGKSNYRSREISEAFTVLEKALLLHLIYPTTKVHLPAEPNQKKSPKLQLLDTGLVAHFAGLQGELLQTTNLDQIFRGKIGEHVVGQEILSSNTSALYRLSFWVREKKQSNAEIDFVIPSKHGLIPVEVKAGSVGRLRSLHQFMNRTNHPYSIRIYKEKLSIDTIKTISGKPFYLLNLPYYLSGRLYDYIEWFVDKVGK